MKDRWEESESIFPMGSEMKAERKFGRVQEGPSVWTFGTAGACGVVGGSLVIRKETRMWPGIMRL